MKNNKQKYINLFINNIFHKNSKVIINKNKDFIIKALRLLNDDMFWCFYRRYDNLRKILKNSPNVNQVIKKYSQTNNYYKNKQLKIIDNIISLIKKSKKLIKSTREEMIFALHYLKSSSFMEESMDNFINNIFIGEYNGIISNDIKDFCSMYKYDINTLYNFILQLTLFNNYQVNLLKLSHNISKNKCQLILDDKHPKFWLGELALIRIFPNTKKQHIKNFIDDNFYKIKDFFCKYSSYYKTTEKIQNLPNIYKYSNFEFYKKSNIFYRELKIYYYYLNGKNDKKIFDELDLPDNYELDTIRKIISNYNKLIQKNYSEDLRQRFDKLMSIDTEKNPRNKHT